MRRFSVVVYVLLVAIIALLLHHRSGPTPADARIGGTFALTDTQGHAVKNTDFHGRPLIVYMGYSHCPDICPATLTAIASTLKALGPDAANVTPLFITLDPARDTPAVLAQYLKSFDPRIIGLTGPKAAIDQVVREYRAYYRKRANKAAPADTLIDHSGFVYVMDKNGRLAELLHSDAKPDDIVKAVKEAEAK